MIVADLTAQNHLNYSRVRQVSRKPLRCSHCGGNVFLDVDIGGHLYDLRCMLCSRSQGDMTAVELLHLHQMERRALTAADWGRMQFLSLVSE